MVNFTVDACLVFFLLPFFFSCRLAILLSIISLKVVPVEVVRWGILL